MNAKTMTSDKEVGLPRSIPVLKPSFEASKVLENRFLSLDIGEAMELFTRVYGSGMETISEDHSMTGKEEDKFNQREKERDGNQLEIAESLRGPEREIVVETDPLHASFPELQTEHDEPYLIVQAEDNGLFSASAQSPQDTPQVQDIAYMLEDQQTDVLIESNHRQPVNFPDVKASNEKQEIILLSEKEILVQPESVLDTSSTLESQILEMLISLQRDMQELRSTISKDVKQLQVDVKIIKDTLAAINVSAPVNPKVDLSPIEVSTERYDGNIAKSNDITELKSEKKSRRIAAFLRGVSLIIGYIVVVLLVITIVYSAFHFITPTNNNSASQGQVNLTTNQGIMEKIVNPLMDRIRTPMKAIQAFFEGIKKNAEIKLTKPDLSLTDLPDTPVPYLTLTP